MASWVEKIKTKFQITTGDGKVYAPLSFNANRSVEYNVAEFNFPNLSGTLVEKRRPMGTVYNLDIYFLGGDNIDVATDFQKSADNSSPWIISHPFYGRLIVQPISPIFHDNGNKILNATRITVTVRETISRQALVATQSPNDVIAAQQASTAQHFADYYVNAIPVPSVKDITQMKSDLSDVEKALINIQANANNLKNAYNAANAAIDNAIGNISGAISAIQTVLALPALIADTIANRVGYLVSEFVALGAQIDNLHLVKPSLKGLWFLEAGTCISAICLAAITNISATDYVYSSQVMNIISQLTSNYNNYLAALDGMQTATGSEPDSWMPDATTMINLDGLVNLTLATLFDIQQNSRQPRTLTLTRDSNTIYIAWQIYGLLPDDSTIDQLIADNNISGIELLQIEKGRQILYYV